jgi:hypothetical protein
MAWKLPDMKGPDSPDTRDRALEYVFGEMSTEERIAFELELADDPQLAAEVAQLFDLDVLAHQVLRERAKPAAEPGRERRNWFVASLLAAAASIVALLVVDRLVLDRSPSSETDREAERSDVARADLRVGVSAGPLDPIEFANSLQADSGAMQVWTEQLRSLPNGQVDAAVAPELAAACEELMLRESQLYAQALAGEVRVARGESFVVLLDLEVESWTLVVGLDADSRLHLFHPEVPDFAAIHSDDARVPAGAHVLPSARFVAVEDEGKVDYRLRRGFVVPLDRKRVHVLVATRPRAFSPEELGRLATAAHGWVSDDPFSLQNLLLETFPGATVVALEVRED